MTARTYGWRPDLPDQRDRYHATTERAFESLPDHVDHRGNLPACWNQGALGSCTAHALGGAIVHELTQRGRLFDPSFLQPYYLARELRGEEHQDNGAYIRDICRIAARYGVAELSKWSNSEPYMLRPDRDALASALVHRISSYKRVPRSSWQLRAALAAGDCVIFGASVYESFEDVGEGGYVQLPHPKEQLLGGHAMLLCGYDDRQDAQCFIVRNSWGTGWGDKGYCYMPYEYVLDADLCDDFWIVSGVTT